MCKGRLSAILFFVAAAFFCSSCQGRADEMTQEIDGSAVRAGMKKSITSKEQQQIGGLEKLDFDKRCESKRDIVYRERVGSDDDFDKMDIYCPRGADGHKPVVVLSTAVARWVATSPILIKIPDCCSSSSIMIMLSPARISGLS